jgi:diaminopimelate decarboxylase
LSATKNSGYKVVAEPGRHFSQESCHLAVRVIGKRVKNQKLCYHVNDGLYHSFNGILMDGMNFEN